MWRPTDLRPTSKDFLFERSLDDEGMLPIDDRGVFIQLRFPWDDCPALLESSVGRVVYPLEPVQRSKVTERAPKKGVIVDLINCVDSFTHNTLKGALGRFPFQRCGSMFESFPPGRLGIKIEGAGKL